MILAKANFLNGPLLLIQALRGVRIVLIDDPPREKAEKMARIGGGMVHRLLRRFRNVSTASALDPRLAIATWYFDSLLLADLFGMLEPWQDRHYRFERVDADLPEYGLCFRAMICSLRYYRQFDIFTRHCIAERHPGENVALVGFDRDTVAALHFLLGENKEVSGRRGSIATRLINAVVAVGCGLGGALALLGFVRCRKMPEARTYLLADYIGDSADTRIYDLAAAYGPVTVVARNRKIAFDDVTAPGHAHRRRRSDAGIYWREFPAYVAELFHDIYALYKAVSWLSVREFFSAADLPRRKLAARALVRTFRPHIFYARDAYNYDHILRHGELKKIGARHYSINVGYPAYTIIFPTSRYMSFDTYFGYGCELYLKHYADRWPNDMRLVPSGSIRPTSDQFERSRQGGGSGDIAVFSGVMIPEPGMIEFVRTLAAAVPERKILLQLKPKYAVSAVGREFLQKCTRDLANVVQTTDTVYEILEQVEFSFTDPSSIVVEAMSMGVYSFLVDICDWHRTCFYRDYPEVVVHSGAAAAEKIRMIESAPASYPWDRMKDVADLSGDYFVDRFEEVMRSDFPCKPLQAEPMPARAS